MPISTNMRVAILFDRFGPYHIARIKAAAKWMTVLPIEISGETSEYQWDKVEDDVIQNRITLFKNVESKKVATSLLKKALEQAFAEQKPDAVAVNGWSDPSAVIALFWCKKNNIPSIVMSESAQGDENRVWWKEVLKKIIVRQFGGALVGGIRHKNYLIALGLKKDQIFAGYDVVDNKYFETAADNAEGQRHLWQEKKNLPANYFLVVSRFIEKKNLFFVIKAYGQYYNKTGNSAWHLLILGDGPLKGQLTMLVNELGLNHVVHFEGFKQYNDLPIYFGLAKAFIHASTIEQWGLVVNEAMASGLPVIISERCGCVPELVHNGKNGYVINPLDQGALTNILQKMSGNSVTLEEMAKESKKIVANFDSDKFGSGLLEAVKYATNHPLKNAGIITRLVLQSLIKR